MVTRARPGKVTVNIAAIQSIFDAGGAVRANADEMAQEMRGIARRSVAGSRKTGTLDRSYQATGTTSYMGCYASLWTTAEHGKWYERGTASAGLGYITPKRGKTFKIPMGAAGFVQRSGQPAGAAFAYPKRVRGQRPKHTMENAMRIMMIQRGLL